MITTDIQYIFLNLFMMAIFIICGSMVSKDRKSYWKYAIWCVIAFTFVLGFRYMRGNDYERYVHTFLYDDDTDQWLFTEFNRFLRNILEVGPHFFTVYYSAVFMGCAMIFLKDYRKYAMWLFPFFLMSFTIMSEYTFRQGLGYSFIFLYTMALTKEKWEWKKKIPILAITLACAFSIHSANLISGVIITFIWFFLRRPIPPIISIPAFIFATFFFSQWFDFSWLNNTLSFLGGVDEKFSEYAEGSDFWFSEDSANETWKRNFYIQIWQTWGECSLLYLGYVVCKHIKEPKMVLTFNLYVIGILVVKAFWTNEILRRMGETMYPYWAFALAMVLYYRKKIKLLKINNMLLTVVFGGLSFYLYEYLKYIFLRENDQYHFIWDVLF